MRCPMCGGVDTRVIDSRVVGEGEQVRRRRECMSCTERFTTYESAELSLPRVVKRDGTREPFDENKLRSSLEAALQKRPVPSDHVEAALSRVQRTLTQRGDRELRSREVGQLVMAQLRDLDQVAYVRFASVYRSFQDVNDFREEIERLDAQPTPELRRDQLPLIDDDE
ncbi:MAG: transcriptional repressor NrdR [Chromatiales bacterium]|jgi:transcriptional repressor NrdR|nr:transcriptional repressor NrdR [Chromatiales bacterium]